MSAGWSTWRSVTIGESWQWAKAKTQLARWLSHRS